MKKAKLKKPKINFDTMGRLLVLIDAANLESSVKALDWWIDYKRLKSFFEKGRLVSIHHYCVHHGTDTQNNFFTVLKRLGYTLVTKPIKLIRDDKIEKHDLRKANFDVEIAVDALKLIDNYDTLILFSGDSDFNYLIKYLRNKNKKVFVISTRYHISRELIQSSNRYIDLRHLKDRLYRQNKSPSFTTGS